MLSTVLAVWIVKVDCAITFFSIFSSLKIPIFHEVLLTFFRGYNKREGNLFEIFSITACFLRLEAYWKNIDILR